MASPLELMALECSLEELHNDRRVTICEYDSNWRRQPQALSTPQMVRFGDDQRSPD